MPKKINESPDIVTMYRTEHEDKPIQAKLQDVEVVEYGENSTEDLAEFLLTKKLDPSKSGKAYDTMTIVVCHITKAILEVNHEDLHEQLSKFKPKPELYLLGGIPNEKPGQHRLRRVWPQLDAPVEFNIFDEALNYPKPDSLKLSLGTGKAITFGNSRLPLPDRYEVFELDEHKTKAKYSSKSVF